MQTEVLLPFLFMVLALVACEAPEACIMAPEEATVGEVVYVSNCSERARQYSWLVGCGHDYTEVGDDIALTFSESGVYQIKLLSDYGGKNAGGATHNIVINRPSLAGLSLKEMSLGNELHLVPLTLLLVTELSELDEYDGILAFTEGGTSFNPMINGRKDCKPSNSSAEYEQCFRFDGSQNVNLLLTLVDTAANDTMQHTLYTEHDFNTGGQDEMNVVFKNDIFSVALDFDFAMDHFRTCIIGAYCD